MDKTMLQNLFGYHGSTVFLTKGAETLTWSGGERESVVTIYNDTGATQQALSSTVAKAACLYYAAMEGKPDDCWLPTTDAGFRQTAGMIVKPNGVTYAEIRTGEETFDIASYNPASGAFMASTVDRTSGSAVIREYVVGEGERNGTVLMLAMLPSLIQDTEANNAIQEAFSSLSNTIDMKKHLTLLSANIYYRIKRELVKSEIRTRNKSGKKVSSLRKFTQDSLTGGVYGVAEGDVQIGALSIFLTTAVPGKKGGLVKMEDLAGKFVMSKRTLTATEEAMVPVFPKDYQCSRETLRAATLIQKSTGTKHLVRNGLYFGEPGTGKTTIVKEIAAALHLPYTVLTCDPSTEIFNLVGQILPSIGTDSKQLNLSDTLQMLDLPTLDDIHWDLAGSYYRLTGEKELPKAYDESECIELLIKKLYDYLGKAQKKDGDFMYVPSELVKALKYGYVCEIQEPANIRQPGVLTGLNNIMDINSGVITLPTGESFQRHPDAVVFYTTNLDLEGCRALNQSVISRCQIVKGIDIPDEDTMVQRVLFDTDADNKSFVKQCVRVAMHIKEDLKKNYITDGSCGVREVIDWVQATVILGDPIEAADCTIIPKATMDAEMQEHIKTNWIEVEDYEDPVIKKGKGKS